MASRTATAGTVKPKHPNKVTAGVKNAADKVKKKAADYKGKIEEAYSQGYQDGYKAAETLPKARGARVAAQTGYGNGIKNRRKQEKIETKNKKAGVTRSTTKKCK